MTATEPTTGSATTATTSLRDLLRWHLGSGSAAPLGAGALPALLAPFRDSERVRHDYPLVLEHDGEQLRLRPLGEQLQTWMARAAQQARVLQDNLPRLERRVRVLLAQDDGADAVTLLRRAGKQMLAEMQLRDSIAAGAEQDLEAIWQALPPVELLPLQPTTPLRLLLAAATLRATTARRRFADRVTGLAAELAALLQVEAQKDPGARDADAVQSSLGGTGTRFFDPAALARSLGQHRGGVRADATRRQRLQQALQTLQQQLAAAPLPLLVALHAEPLPPLPGAVLQQVADVCGQAMQQFDAFAAPLLRVIAAMQLAELALRGAYEPERHDAMLAALDWQDLATEDLQQLPVIAAMAPAATFAGRDLQALTQLLLSGRPVQVLALQAPARDPAHADAVASRSRFELGYLGIACRDAYVQQSTAARPAHLLAGLQRAVNGNRAGLHVVDSGLDANAQQPPLGAFLHAGAAIEGRAHPLFQYDPDAGDTWARRLDFGGNPSPEADWPTSECSLPTPAGGSERRPLPFTFADYALLEPQLRLAFAAVPDALQAGELVPLCEHLQLDAAAARRCVPFVWVATADGKTLHRAAVQRPLLHACRDRLRFWRTLQELAGVRNDHVREAVQRARQEAAEQASREREALQAQHEAELERVRADAAGSAMQGLARMLLELDPLGDAMPSPRPATPAPMPVAAAASAAPVAAAAAPPAAAVVADDDGFDEPWIESVRCSTCNDCVNLNPLLFVYNENKQARIADARAGTYAQLVQAAEKCPSRCIHPGKPLNPAEPDLDALVARAAPFNS